MKTQQNNAKTPKNKMHSTLQNNLTRLVILGSLITGANAATVCCSPTFSCSGSTSPDPDPSCQLSVGSLCEVGGIDTDAGYAQWDSINNPSVSTSARVYNPSTISTAALTTSSSDYICMIFSPGSSAHCVGTGEDDLGNTINSTISITFGAAVSSGSTGSMDFNILAAYTTDAGATFTQLGLASHSQAAYSGTDEYDAITGASNVPGWNVSQTSASWAINTGILAPGESIEVRFFLQVNDNTHTGDWTDDNDVKAVFIDSVGGGDICSISSIPEPASSLLLGLGSILFTLRRGRRP